MSLLKKILLCSTVLFFLTCQTVQAQIEQDAIFSKVTTSSGNDTANYTVTFESTWSSETHPHDNFPSSAHYSPLIGAVHNENAVFWSPGQVATLGIERMAESGSTSPLDTEIDAAITTGTALTRLQGNGLGTSPGTVVLDMFAINRGFPQVTLVTMVAPSPDWFVGVHGHSLLDSDGNWRDTHVVELDPYDAGTDSGADYTSPNANTDPAQPITNLSGQFPFSSEPLGTFTFTRIQVQFIQSIYIPWVQQ